MKKEEAKKLADLALTDLQQELEAGRSETLQRYLDTLSRFHSYSFCNCMLIGRQKPDATYVAGFRRWLELGRHVRKGEKGIGILAPLVYRKRKDEADDGEEMSGPSVRGFKIVHVFDVSQTDGEELPELARIQGEPGDLLPALEGLVRDNGIELTTEILPLGTKGVSRSGGIIIAEGLDESERFAVLAHELAHLCGDGSYVNLANLLAVRWSGSQQRRPHNRRRCGRMFETLVRGTVHLKRYQTGPYADERRRFLEHLRERGYSRGRLQTVNRLLLSVAQNVCFDSDAKFLASQLVAMAKNWFQTQPDRGGCEKSIRSRELDFLFVAKQWLRFLKRLDTSEPPRPFDHELSQFLSYLHTECGFAETTIDNRRNSMALFFDWLSEQGRPLSQVRLDDMSAYQRACGRRDWKRTTISLHVQALRAFFRYAASQGWARDIASGIAAPRIQRGFASDQLILRQKALKPLLTRQTGPVRS